MDETDRIQDNQSKKAVKRSTTAAVMRTCSLAFCYNKAKHDITGGIIERQKVVNAFSRRPSVCPSQLNTWEMNVNGVRGLTLTAQRHTVLRSTYNHHPRRS